MTRILVGIAALAVLSACGSGVFDEAANPEDTTVVVGDATSNVPDDIAGEIDSITYNPTTDTLVVTGVRLDDTPFEATYSRNAALDQGDYRAFTSQNNSLSRQYTAFVAQRDGVNAGVTGSGQFTTFLAGATYSRSGAYDPPADIPATGIVNYIGRYVGVLNVAGAQTDVLPVPPGTPDAFRPTQVATVTGDILINADFSGNAVEGAITNRQVAVNSDPFNTPLTTSAETLADIVLVSTGIDANGEFSGTAGLDLATPRGTYAGIFGGTNASTVGGGVNLADHVSTSTGSSFDIEGEEYGVFVLPGCNTADADPLCP